MDRREFLALTASLPFAGAIAADQAQAASKPDSNIVFSTGIKSLDEMLGGGLAAGTLTLVVSATGVGRTALCSSIALAQSHSFFRHHQSGCFDWLSLKHQNGKPRSLAHFDDRSPKNMEDWGRRFRMQACLRNEANVCSLMVRRRSIVRNEMSLEEISPWSLVLSADYIIQLHKDTHGSIIFVTKNRYGRVRGIGTKVRFTMFGIEEMGQIDLSKGDVL